MPSISSNSERTYFHGSVSRKLKFCPAGDEVLASLISKLRIIETGNADLHKSKFITLNDQEMIRNTKYTLVRFGSDVEHENDTVIFYVWYKRSDRNPNPLRVKGAPIVAHMLKQPVVFEGDADYDSKQMARATLNLRNHLGLLTHSLPHPS